MSSEMGTREKTRIYTNKKYHIDVKHNVFEIQLSSNSKCSVWQHIPLTKFKVSAEMCKITTVNRADELT